MTRRSAGVAVTLGHASRLGRAVERRRRPAAAALAALAVVVGLRALSPTGAPGGALVVVATRDLPAGTVVSAEDVRSAAVSPAPVGALVDLSAAVGQTLAAPVRRGEVVVDVRLLRAAAAQLAHDGLVVAPVRIADAATVALVRPGTLVDVVAADGQGSGHTVAAAARVVAVPSAESRPLDTASGALLVVAVPPHEAVALAGAAAMGPLSVVLRG